MDSYFWRQSSIEEQKDAIRAELDSEGRLKGAQARLEHGLKRIAELESDESSLAQLRRFIYGVAVLFHHARHGGLTGSQVSHIRNLCEALLRVNGVKPGFNRTACLHADLRLSLSRIYSNQGQSWKALWEQQFSQHLSPKGSSGGETYFDLTHALRSQQAGNLSACLSALEGALASGKLGQKQKELASIEMLRTLRLAGRPEEARKLIDGGLGAGFSPSALREIAWEKKMLRAQQGKVSEIFQAVQSTHSDESYALDAFFLARTLKSREFLAGDYSLRKLCPELSQNRYAKFARLFERLYDTELPLTHRIELLGRELEKIKELASIEKELLIWAASARWLARSKAKGLAQVALEEYRALSLRLSEGKTHDVLQIMNDLQARSPSHTDAA